MQFAKRVYLVAGVLGLLLTVPPLFMEGMEVRFGEPAVNHPELYYGFLVVVLAWQLVYLAIGMDPVRLRPMMLLAAFAKGTVVVTYVALWAAGRIPPRWLGFAAFDGTFVVLFLMAYRRTPDAWPSSASAAPAEEREKVAV
jgi:hypothetical protein